MGAPSSLRHKSKKAGFPERSWEDAGSFHSSRKVAPGDGLTPPVGTEADSSVRTMAQAPGLFWWAEKSANKSERGFNNPMATSDQSVKKSGIQDCIRITFGVENIEGSTSMSGNARAPPPQIPAQGTVGVLVLLGGRRHRRGFSEEKELCLSLER